MTDELDALSDAQLSETFAVEVAKTHEPIEPVHNDPRAYRRLADNAYCGAGEGFWVGNQLPPFATSVDAVLPFVWAYLDNALYSARLKFWRAFQACGTLESGNTPHWPDCLGLAIRDGKVARYLCIALIRAARAKKGQP